MEFKNKIVLVTGAASGMGLATSKLFHKQGAVVILADKNPQNLELAVQDFKDERALSLTVDLTKESDVERLVEEIRSRFGRLDVLVNNAGTIAYGGVENVSLSQLDSLYNLMARAMYHLTSSCVPLLKIAKGRVVNVSSVASSKANDVFIGYSMMKASVDAFTRCVAKELAPLGIRVNSVNPGIVYTGLFANSGVPDLFEGFDKKVPLGRIGRPEDISEVICFLASDKASYITGVNLLVDGGFSL